MMKKNKDTHILMVTLDAQGHMNPMLCLAKRLITHSLKVTVATTQTAKPKLLSSAAHYISGIDFAFFSDGLPPHYNRSKDLNAYVQSISHHGPPNLSNLIRDLYATKIKPSCIITNPFVPWVVDVAAEFGIKCALLWIQPCILYAFYYRFYNNSIDLELLEEDKADMKWVVELPGVPALKKEDLPSFVLESNKFGSIAEMIADVMRSLEKYEWVLGNSFHELEREVIEFMTGLYAITPVGPLIPSFLLQEEGDCGLNQNLGQVEKEECIQWLNQQTTNSVIYVSFGSIIHLSSNQIDNIATGLKNTHRPFLWAANLTEEDPQPSEHKGHISKWFIKETCKNGLVIPWCTQTAVLAHPAVACFVTHCGWNSLLEAIAAGVPIIAYPQWTDQPTNAKLVVDVLRIGVRVRVGPDGIVRSDEVARCVEEVMGGARVEEYRDRAMKLKMASRDAVKEGGSTDCNILMFVETIKGMDASF